MEEENKNVEQEPAVETPAVEPAPEVAPTEPVPAEQPVPEAAPVEQPVAEPVEPKKKGNGGLILLLLILVVGAGFAAWYFALGGKDVLAGKKEEPKQEEKKEEKKEEETKEEAKIVELKEEDVKEYESLINEVLYVKLDKDELSVNDLSNQDILFFGLNGMYDFKEKTKVNAEVVKSNIIKKLGSVNYMDENYLCRMDKRLLLSFKENGEYIVNTDHGGHGSYILRVYKYFQSAEENQDKGILTIKYKMIFLPFDDILVAVGFNTFATEKDAFNETNVLKSVNVPEDYKGTRDDLVKEVYDDNKDKIPVVTVTFEKDMTGNYVFKSIK